MEIKSIMCCCGGGVGSSFMQPVAGLNPLVLSADRRQPKPLVSA